MIKKPVPWPNGARCAVAFTFDMDADSILHLAHPKDSYRRLSAISTLRYGPEIGVPRILDTYREFGLKQTFFVPAWCVEQYPRAVEAMVADDHEVAHHGYIHEHPNELSGEEEAYWFRRSIDVIEKHTGQRPRGFRAPLYNMSEQTVELMAEEGFLYDASLMGDDQPYLLRCERGDLVELPSHWGMDDWPPYVHMPDIDFNMPIKAPSEAMKCFREEFDAMWEYGGLWVPVWHPFVSGRLARWREVEKLIQYMVDKGGVWFATMEEIAEHVRTVAEDGTYEPRIDTLPYYSGPVQVGKDGFADHSRVRA
ncbi:polysaccharide deacetylase [Pelagibius sp. Alg239-R121]|uniref:polysaccharide deacetylase family protein n=1 Tax=Pelagibius sp. Alg239-R121 TaxID=2993448 RepID=UPI0024A66D01|nr:polysaccharide deacetylase [Pelagibius sp. Alg239-R121]